MQPEDLQGLRDLGDALDPGAEALAVYSEIFEMEPEDVPAANMMGRSLEELGRDEEALEHWDTVIAMQPENRIAMNRLTRLEQRMRTRRRQPRVAAAVVHRAPVEIVEPNFPGPGRDACLGFLARSILMTERIDASRLAVTDRPSDGRFRVSGGKGSGVTPRWGLLCVFVHAPAVSDDTHQALAAAGATIVFRDGGLKSLPASREYGIPPERVADVAALLESPHREHLKHSIAAGPPPWARRHDPALRDYIVEQGGSV
jgi:tetratricopeptide (TPR) repeat protein